MSLPDQSKIVLDMDVFLSDPDKKNKTIVFTNGCFDLLHNGHLHLIKEAKKEGDHLIVGINDDASVKRLKGETRPVENIEKRMLHLAQLKEVDFIIPFSEDTPLLLIEKIKPAVLVKGGDYIENEIVGADFVKSNGGKVVLVPLLKGFSTTKSIRFSK